MVGDGEGVVDGELAPVAVGALGVLVAVERDDLAHVQLAVGRERGLVIGEHRLGARDHVGPSGVPHRQAADTIGQEVGQFVGAQAVGDGVLDGILRPPPPPLPAWWR